jgi:hypothetical protein
MEVTEVGSVFIELVRDVFLLMMGTGALAGVLFARVLRATRGRLGAADHRNGR